MLWSGALPWGCRAAAAHDPDRAAGGGLPGKILNGIAATGPGAGAESPLVTAEGLIGANSPVLARSCSIALGLWDNTDTVYAMSSSLVPW